MRSAVVVGDAMVDVVARHDGPLAPGSDTPASVQVRPGGAAANVAAWLARSMMAVTLVARVGDDALADLALGGLDGVSLHVNRDPRARTGTCVVLVGPDGERTMLPDAGANQGLTQGELPPTFGDVLYVSGYTLLRAQTRPAAQAALARARAAGARTVVDAASAAPLRAAPGFLSWLGTVDLLLANADEAEVLGSAMHRHAAEVVVKHGAGGASWSDGERSAMAPAVAATAVDTTGAGDAFAAGFLSAWSRDPTHALARGALLAARAVEVEGAR